jgi:hypothetical protein
VERNVYLENLISWVKNSQEKISAGGVEIPDDLSPTDLYCDVYLIHLDCFMVDLRILQYVLVPLMPSKGPLVQSVKPSMGL